MDASLTLTVAFTAGVLSFLSPCVLPLIPSYATFVTGMSLEELTGRAEQVERAGRGRDGEPCRYGRAMEQHS